MNKIDLIDQNSGLKYNTGRIEDFCLKLLDSLNINNWEFSILFCSDEYISQLNKDYRNKEGPTDILTFCDADTSSEWNNAVENKQFFAGDMIISAETLENNSEYFNVDSSEELKRLLIHGILHFKGMDHKTNNSEEEMLIYQEKILNNFGDYKF